MPFVKLDCGIMESSLWLDPDALKVFITALLLAKPFVLEEDSPAFNIRDLKHSGFIVPAGEYGYARVSPNALITRAMFDCMSEDAQEDGLSALEALCNGDRDSRTPDHGGRRMARIDGGFAILNYKKYRDMDYTAAARKRRQREREKEDESHRDTVTCHAPSRNVTQAEAEAEIIVVKEKKKKVVFSPPSLEQAESYGMGIGMSRSQCGAFVDYWETRGWIMKGGQQMKSWASAMRTWKANASNFPSSEKKFSL